LNDNRHTHTDTYTHMLDYKRKNFNADLGIRFMICTPHTYTRVIKSRIRWEVHVECMGDRRYVYSLLVGRPEGMKPFGSSWHRWEDNSKMDLQKVGWGGMGWTDLVQDRDRWLALVKVVMNRLVSPIEGNFIS